MQTNEKEINNYLFDQLEIIEEALSLVTDNESPVAKYLIKKKGYIERKLYQNPPLTNEKS